MTWIPLFILLAAIVTMMIAATCLLISAALTWALLKILDKD